MVRPALEVADILRDHGPALARAHPGKLNWATTTGYSDFLFAAFLKNTGLTMSKVPYRDTVQASNDLGEGRIQMYWGALAIVRPQVQAGKAKLLAISNSQRAPDEPDVPTIIEAGFPALLFDGLVGLFGPRDIAVDVRERVVADVQAVASDPAMTTRLVAAGQLVSPGGAAEFAASIEEQRARLAATAREMDFKRAQ